MESLIPRTAIEEKLRKHCSIGKGGRPASRLEVMLRVHCLQLFYDLSDLAIAKCWAMAGRMSSAG